MRQSSLISSFKHQKTKTEKQKNNHHKKNHTNPPQKTNQALTTILENIQDGLIIVDNNWNIRYITQRAAKTLNIETKKNIDKNFWHQFPKYQKTPLEKNLRTAMTQKNNHHFEWHNPTTDTTWEISTYPKNNTLVITWQNITKRKKQEKNLHLNNERHAKAFNHCQTALLITRLTDGYLIDANEAFLLTFGFNRKEIIGNTTAKLNIYPDPNTRKNFTHILQTQTTIHNIEVLMQTKTGNPITLITSIDPITINGQNYTLCTFTDITERKKFETIRKENEEHLKLSQHLAHMGNWAHHITENKTVWSDELYHIFNLQPDKYEPDRETHKNYIHPDDFERVAKIADTFALEGKLDESTFFDYRIVLADGTIRDLHTEHTITEVDKEGKPTKIMGIEQDITERKKAEQQLELHRRYLEQLVEERTNQLADSERLATIGQTAGMVGHDIRNPLQAIMSSLYLIKEDLALMTESEEKKDVLQELDVIGEQVSYIDKIIADLQDYARPIKPEYAEVDIAELIDSIFQAVRLPSMVTLRVNIDALPKLRTDPTLIRRTLTNLVNNAIQVMGEGGVLTIRTYQSSKAGNVVIEVEDTGGGVPIEAQDKIFTPLFTTKSKGQGFGLAVVKRITDALGGAISFKSQEGKGAKFIIELPANQSENVANS
ncbi:MAG: PAS domain S-box protein [Nitrososphaerota archaeon]|nr:PAS domain S-box protein [Nitrososphaerota archaeon]